MSIEPATSERGPAARPSAKSDLGAAPVRDGDRWLKTVCERRDDGARQLLEASRDYIERTSGKRVGADGEAFALRAFAVGQILHDLDVDAETVAAGALAGLAGLEPPVPPPFTLPGAPETEARVQRLVEAVARLQTITEIRDTTSDERQVERLRRLLLSMVDDVRAALIILAERLHMMRMLSHHPEETRAAVAGQTLALFGPLASRLGIWQVKWELEDLSLRHQQPAVYKDIAGQLAERRVDRERYMERVVERVSRELREAGIEAAVSGRPKHIYSIWRKMRAKALDFNQLFDVRAVRVITGSVADCYAILGVVHSLWSHVPHEFDDYIANPKPNRYQSLHTAVVGPEGRTLEVQIRTQEMHQHAERGVAAHWRYKEGDAAGERALDNRLAWMRQALEWRAAFDDPDRLWERINTDLDEERVYVLTPRGRVLDLPAGATPVDFAYRVHTDVGHRCRGARVDGVMVTLTRQLRNGETVEILTARDSAPSRDWLNGELGYLTSARARAKVRQWFRQQDYAQNLADGREAWERELRRLRMSQQDLSELPARFNLTSVDDLFAAIGRGDVQLGQVMRLTHSDLDREPQPRRVPARSPGPTSGGVTVQGVGELLTNLARCCAPVPPEAIVGYITRGRGITIHRRTCPNAARLSVTEPARVIDVDWGGDEGRRYTIELLVKGYDRRGLLRDISAVLANDGIDVRGFNSSTSDADHVVTMHISLDVHDVGELSRVIGRVLQVRNVFEATRTV